MVISPWLLVLFAFPVLFLGDWLLKHVRIFSQFHLPSPVIGGLVISLLILFINLAGLEISFADKISAKWWTWLVTIEPEWRTGPAKGANLVFLIGFFTCVGLNATWLLLKRGGIQIAIFLGLTALLAVLQNGIGMLLAWFLGESMLLGLACGSVTMTGGHGTGLGFADLFAEMGLEGAPTILMAAATFGLVLGGLIGGPVGGRLIRRRGLESDALSELRRESEEAQDEGATRRELHYFKNTSKQSLQHLLLVALCIKMGAWASYFIVNYTGLTFPVYIGAMLMGVCLRNLADLLGLRWMDTEVIENLSALFLGVFLAMALMNLNLLELAGVAGPMLIILSVQVVFVGIFATFATFVVMGRDYEAAIMAGGHCGFALGATPNAVANMKQLVTKYGAAPRAFLVVPIVGAFLNDFTNVLAITSFLNFAK